MANSVEPPLSDRELLGIHGRALETSHPTLAIDSHVVLAMTEEIRKHRSVNSDFAPGIGTAKKIAEYIFVWLEARNDSELYEALTGMSVQSRRLAMKELEQILVSGGKPPNWTKP